MNIRRELPGIFLILASVVAAAAAVEYQNDFGAA